VLGRWSEGTRICCAVFLSQTIQMWSLAVRGKGFVTTQRTYWDEEDLKPKTQDPRPDT